MIIIGNDKFVLRKRHMPYFLPNSREIFAKSKFWRLHSSHFTLFFPSNDENMLRCSRQFYYY